MSFEAQNKPEFSDEKEAWQKLRVGSLDALGFFYDKYADDLFNIGISIKRDRALVKDAIHDSFIELYKYHSNLSIVKNIRSYLITSFKRTLFKSIKAKDIILKSYDFENNLYALDTSNAENTIIDMELYFFKKNKLQKALKCLTPHQATALKLKFIEDRSYSEIAANLNVSISSARTLVYRSIKELRKKIIILFF
ncbi:RNA polymerase sigma factor [Zunongwangia endophytica]|uniref:RNA polymerase sigma factor n=1 Tax=Zunongwangia endophytica TaxID=1808945 RepID=A0ABV8HBT4_9FLAO|nr:sigma-70 family RNA polymerase sigma factor [Zunongwangia endophytica]MDN3594862.1 sigma-70 family RNA polymerase sigma factor [Zunongwangia endophytica]